jgi:hypothetical protein
VTPNEAFEFFVELVSQLFQTDVLITEQAERRAGGWPSLQAYEREDLRVTGTGPGGGSGGFRRRARRRRAPPTRMVA